MIRFNNHDEKHINYLKDAYEKHKYQKKKWVFVADEMNKEFEYSSKDTWRTRYRRIDKDYVKKVQEQKSINRYKNRSTGEVKNLLIKLLNRPKNIDFLEQATGLSETEILGYVSQINLESIYHIKTIKSDSKITLFIDRSGFEKTKEYNYDLPNKKIFKFMVVGDSHLGSIYEQLTFLNYLYDIAVEKNIPIIYHVGDISDGTYLTRPEQLYSLHKIGFERQLKHIVQHYPQRVGIETHFILGNHDEVYIRQGGANLGTAISYARKDMKFLGIGSAKIWLTENCNFELLHPLDGSSYAISYSGQKYMDSLSGGDKPNILFVGHHHKTMYFVYRNIHYFEVPSTCMQSDWEKRKRLNNNAGAWIITVAVDDDGSITSIIPEYIQQYHKIADDYKKYPDLEEGE